MPRVDAGARPKRLGCEVPRIFTPPLRELTEETSDGFSVIRFADEVLGVDLLPWQRWLLIHALELHPDIDTDPSSPRYRYQTIVVLVARQNGKSTLSKVLALWAMFILGIALVIGTAQDLDVAEDIWDDAVELVKEIPALNRQIRHVDKTNGKKSLRLRSGERWKVKAANRSAGRGLSGDLVILDELREHRNWEAWSAITKTTLARPDAQVWCFSNAGDAVSIVARYLRRLAHASLGDPDGIVAESAGIAIVGDDWAPDDEDLEQDEETLGFFEWSAPPGLSKWDRDGWAQANPSLGYGFLTERSLAAACRTDPEWEFRTEVLCQWSDGTLEGPFPPGSWEAGIDPKSAPDKERPPSFCVDSSWDRSLTYIAAAGWRPDGDVHVELRERRAGVEWVPGWVKQRLKDHGPFRLVIQARGAPVSAVVDALEPDPSSAEAAEFEGLELVKMDGSDLAAACGRVYDVVRAHLWEPDEEAGETEADRPAHKLWHRAAPALDLAAATAATKPSQDAWFWDRRKSPHDAAPLVAATGAVWDVLTRPAPAVSVYEERGLMSVDL